MPRPQTDQTGHTGHGNCAKKKKNKKKHTKEAKEKNFVQVAAMREKPNEKLVRVANCV